jgi:hypothetical protein
MPNGPAFSRHASDSAAAGWRDLRPDLHAEPYVFAPPRLP